MQAGKLRHRVTIEALTEPQSEGGAITQTWTTVAARIPAEVLPDRAGEYFAARQIQSTTNAMIRLTHRDDITAKMRVVHHVTPTLDHYWDIEGVVPLQYARQELRLMCLKRDAEGFRRGTDVANG